MRKTQLCIPFKVRLSSFGKKKKKKQSERSSENLGRAFPLILSKTFLRKKKVVNRKKVLGISKEICLF